MHNHQRLNRIYMFIYFFSYLTKCAFILASVSLFGTGCSSKEWGFPYKSPVQQGNWITQEQVALLQRGMSRDQVRFTLGSPMLTSVLHSDRWDYPYYYKSVRGTPEERKFTVWFKNGQIVGWEGDTQPNLGIDPLAAKSNTELH